jgi:hypothetical protein
MKRARFDAIPEKSRRVLLGMIRLWVRNSPVGQDMLRRVPFDVAVASLIGLYDLGKVEFVSRPGAVQGHTEFVVQPIKGARL